MGVLVSQWAAAVTPRWYPGTMLAPSDPEHEVSQQRGSAAQPLLELRACHTAFTQQNQNCHQNFATAATHRDPSYHKAQKATLGDLLGRGCPRAGISDVLAAEA